ncbi:keto-hydroxyglutarate-aldolase/keto-deoxy-phosphogluconate aldolase [Streptococcus varani]|jgi:2-dehydro-3-deoxyphosphogluconate aldolase/(4S)-4-hydroxy-2-oxoglutarate aldolase|uniref:Keto-hydroxyglutarate-aldolase/keto-deoxy-phosphogluconate aldolase n=1 Tax=Streptococcus varani TaxID=1608583 RepID=A0A0E4H6T6_9STRE|nr:bifunctional 4-hydroxy-2-oxoglutarate aldolase/2-dehydro-3-deoxy-phosphogluconate aldolase [Streptococcus varani]CQR24008.1 keto-hydroxyglutarate-aldolase/keto-deoxy-phosphogluconate aldolase [Streptococcus varani]
MSKSETIVHLKKENLVSVIRGSDKSEGLHCAIACIEGGISAIEIAYTNSEASSIIKELTYLYKDNSSIIIGAGSVLDAETARLAILAGAKYIVSPSFHSSTARLCNRYAIPYIPGCISLTEMVTALEAGCEMIKLFPGNLSGPSYIKAIKAPLPQVAIMVTGGVNIENILDWFAAKADAVGIGGEFNELAAKGDFDSIRNLAQKYSALLPKD